MTKDEMVTLLRSVNCDENTVTAMSNAYEMGFEQGASAAEILRKVVDEAQNIANAIDGGEAHEQTQKFWGLFDQLRDMQ
jgi:hypothetical protein